MNETLQATATILALVNPAMCAAMFLQATGAASRRDRVVATFQSFGTITVILVVAAIAGLGILNLFGVSLDAFSCAGGAILAWIGAGMMKNRPETSDSSESAESAASLKISDLSPLILFAASPGTITGVITVAAAHSERFIPWTAILAILITAVVLLAVLLVCSRSSQKQSGPGLVRQMITSYMGVIVIAMGVQFILNGLKSFFA